MRAVWFVSANGRLDIAALGFRSDDRLSASLFVRFFGAFGTEAQTNRDYCRSSRIGSDVQRFERQERAYGTFQLESLILAQNERWRQA